MHAGKDARREVAEQQRAATALQAANRGKAARVEMQEQHVAALKVQAIQRGNKARRGQLS